MGHRLVEEEGVAEMKLNLLDGSDLVLLKHEVRVVETNHENFGRGSVVTTHDGKQHAVVQGPAAVLELWKTKSHGDNR